MTRTLDIRVPDALLPITETGERRRYYVAYGGRDSGRSWTFARALIVRCLAGRVLALCAREIMKSIAESVHRLLETQIDMLGLRGVFDVQETKILGPHGSEIIYAGLRTLNVANLKSYEGVNIAWVEEAEAVSKRSWNTLIPTIRAPGSEIWVNFNPHLDTDETYKRFVVRPPENAWVQKVTWRNNPWFSEVLDADRVKMEREDLEEYDNIYNGTPRTVVAGAIYGKEVVRMIEERRFRPVPYDPRLMVHTIWDLGWNDQVSIIFAQRLHSEVRIIDYEEESFRRLDEWVKRINDRPYIYGDHWLPHDGAHETLQGGGVSIQNQLKTLFRGVRPKIIKRAASVEDPIRAARMMWPRAFIDETKCERLMECLKRFRRAVPESTGEPGAPVKDEYRHGADAYGGLAVIVDQLTNDGRPRVKPRVDEGRVADRGMGR